MSDFLGHLAARALAQPSLRPRTRSRFEPAEAEEAPQLNWPATTPKEEAAPAPPAIVQRRAIDQRALPALPSPTTHTEPPVTHEPAANPQPRNPDPSPARPRDSAADAEPERTGRPLPERVVREVEQQTEYVAQPVTEVVEREVRVPVVVTETKSVPEVRHRFEREAPRVVKAAPRQEPAPVRRGTPAGLPAPHRGTPAKRVQESSSVTAPEPVIEVSIGRIEVRAVQSNAPARSAARQTAMSIDDYVAKRKAKERR